MKHLQLSVPKANEIVVDLRRKSAPAPICVSGGEVGIVRSYRYLDEKLEWLRSSGVCSKILHIFYQSVVASTIFSAVVCWHAGIKTKDRSRLKKCVHPQKK